MSQAHAAKTHPAGGGSAEDFQEVQEAIAESNQ
jgi:hypothetical protein